MTPRLLPRSWLVAAFVLFDLGAAALIAPVAADDGEAVTTDADPAATGATAEEPAAPMLLDPQVVDEDGGAWAVGTSTDGATMPRFERGDGGTWEPAGDALAAAPAWASQAGFGPAVVRDGDTWWLFFSAPATDTGRYCLGAASARDPADGFEPQDEPLRCVDGRDVIDPSAHRAGDGLVLTWAERTLVDDETGDETWQLRAAHLDPDGAPALRDAAVLLTASTAEDAGGWEAGVVDAPALVDVDGTLVLLYGGNRWGSADYAAGYAVCAAPLGPCERRTVDEPLDIALDEGQGTGGLQPVATAADEPGGGPAAAFHTLLVDEASGEATETAVHRTELSWRDGALRVAEPTPLDLADE